MITQDNAAFDRLARRATSCDGDLRCNPHTAFPHNSRDIQQRTRLDFARKHWVTNWGGRSRGIVHSAAKAEDLSQRRWKRKKRKRELRIPCGAEADVRVVRRADVARGCAGVDGRVAPTPATTHSECASRGSTWIRLTFGRIQAEPILAPLPNIANRVIKSKRIWKFGT